MEEVIIFFYYVVRTNFFIDWFPILILLSALNGKTDKLAYRVLGENISMY